MNEDIRMNIKFSRLKMAVVLSIILTFLNIAGVLNLSIWIILLPVFLVLAWWFFIIFLVGLVTILILSKEVDGSEPGPDVDLNS